MQEEDALRGLLLLQTVQHEVDAEIWRPIRGEVVSKLHNHKLKVTDGSVGLTEVSRSAETAGLQAVLHLQTGTHTEDSGHHMTDPENRSTAA